MAFGAGFMHTESNEQLADGNYEAKIITAEIKNGSYGDYIQGTLEVNGRKDVYPNVFFLNDSPKSDFGSVTAEQALKMWNQNMTKFFASFGITEGDFDPSHWIGKKGTVTVQVQKKKPEYKEIVMWKKEPYKPQANQSQPSQTTSEASGEKFAEDIPF